MNPEIAPLHQQALDAKQRFRAGEIERAEAVAAIQPYITAWNKIAKAKAKAAGRRAPTLSADYFLRIGS